MNPDETKVHHAIIDLYELEDIPEVTASHVCNYTGMLLKDVNAAMQTLEAENVIGRNDGVVTMAKNVDYFPLANE